MTAGRRGYFPAHDCRIGEGVKADRPGACLGYSVLLCFCLFKTGSIARSVFSAH